jgi:hypothetical protein
MALHADVRKSLLIKLEEYDGRIPHLYVDGWAASPWASAT